MQVVKPCCSCIGGSTDGLPSLLRMQALVMHCYIAQQGSTYPDVEGARQVTHKVVK